MVSGDGVQPLLQPGTARLPRDALGRVVQRVNLVAVAHWIYPETLCSGQLTIFESCLQMNNSTERPVQSGCSQKDDLGCEANARGNRGLVLAGPTPGKRLAQRNTDRAKSLLHCAVSHRRWGESGASSVSIEVVVGSSAPLLPPLEIDVRHHNRNTLLYTPDTRGDEKNATLCLFEGAMCVCCCVIVPAHKKC